MLVLTRKSQEQIRIGDEITISIIKIKGNTVRVGIEAPRDVRILRGELPVFGDEEEEAGEEPSEETAAVTEEEAEVAESSSSSLEGYLRLRRRRRAGLSLSAT